VLVGVKKQNGKQRTGLVPGHGYGAVRAVHLERPENPELHRLPTVLPPPPRGERRDPGIPTIVLRAIIVFPVPLDVLEPFLDRRTGRVTAPPAALACVPPPSAASEAAAR
jgi:hypothetical protein